MRDRKKKELNRYAALAAMMILIFIVIVSRLTYLQIVKAEDFKEQANMKAVREVPEFAPRGKILDSSGTVLAQNRQTFMLVFTETDESKERFFDTMKQVFKILDENGQPQQDDFALKLNPYRFVFRTDNENEKRILELRFKKDRGMDEDIIKSLFKSKKDKYTTEEQEKIDAELLKITPEKTFEFMLEQYHINDNLNPSYYSLDQRRRYLMIKDAIKMQSFSGYKPTVIASNINQETAEIFWQKLNDLPGIDITTQPIREYPLGELGSAFLGYIAPIPNSDQVYKYEEKGYDISSDYVGMAGIERAYEDVLKGSKGGKIVKLNRQGRVIEELGRRDPYPGQNIYLTINKDVQAAAEKALDLTMQKLQSLGVQDNGTINTKNATRGAAVAIDINTGGIIALASRPGYNPNDFAVPGRLTDELYKKFFDPDLEAFGNDYIKRLGINEKNYGLDRLFPIDENIKGKVVRQDYYDLYPKPLFNYATSALLPPGSTFKPLTALAGLQEGIIDEDTKILDDRVFNKYIKNFTGSCWIWNEYKGTHGDIDVKKALEVSCNYYFFEVGHRLYEKGGLDLLAKYAWKFGLGANPKNKQVPYTGIEIPERFGQVYNYESAKLRFGAEYLRQAVDVLKNGLDTRGNRFTPIDIVIHEEDGADTKAMKGKIIDSIKQEMISTAISSSFLSNLKAMFTELSKQPEFKDKNISKGDVSIAVWAVNYSLIDCHAEAKTEANVYSASIGQGKDEFTPVQLANYLATILNGGKRYKVHLVDKFTDSDDKLIKKVEPEVVDSIDLKQSTIDIIKEGMHEVLSGEDGTAVGVFDGLPIDSAGKTGSATFNEVIQNDIGRTSYGVFLGFAPYKDPKIAVCVAIFDGGHGGYAAPVARAIYEAYFKDEIAKINPNYVPMFDFSK